MSVLTELRRLFDAYDAAVAEYKSPLPVDEATFLKREEAVYAATGRLEGAFTRATQRALLNVAEAAEREPRCPFCAEERHIAGWPTQPHLSDCPLAPLVKEATDES